MRKDKISETRDILLKIGEVQEACEYHRWANEIPPIQFAPEWKVRIVPPFGLVLVRFYVEYKGKEVSVFLDGYDLAGTINPLKDKPYWEVYPSFHKGMPCRVPMDKTDDLITVIHDSLEFQIQAKGENK